MCFSKALADPRFKILYRTVNEGSCPAGTMADRGVQELPPPSPPGHVLHPAQVLSPSTPARDQHAQLKKSPPNQLN